MVTISPTALAGVLATLEWLHAIMHNSLEIWIGWKTLNSRCSIRDRRGRLQLKPVRARKIPVACWRSSCMLLRMEDQGIEDLSPTIRLKLNGSDG